MIRKWATKYEMCQQCGTKRFKHIAKGLCTRCAPLIRRLNQIDRWDFAKPQSLKGYPRDGIFWNKKTFQQIKAGLTHEIKNRLDFLKFREQSLQKPIDGIDVEYRLRYIAQRCRVRNKNLFFGIAGYIDNCFDMNQKQILYKLLNDIEESIPWEGPNWTNIFLDSA